MVPLFYSKLRLQIDMSGLAVPDMSDLDLNDDTGDEDSEDGEDLVENGQWEQLPITAAEVEVNYNQMGTLSQPCVSVFSLDQLRQLHPQAFTPQSENALAAVLSDLCLPFSISPLQVAKLSIQTCTILLRLPGIRGEFPFE